MTQVSSEFLNPEGISTELGQKQGTHWAWWIKAKFKSVSYVNVLLSLCSVGSEVGLFSPFPLKQMKESESRSATSMQNTDYTVHGIL